MSRLHRRAFLGLLFLIVVMGTALITSAGTLRYWQAWVFLGLYFVCSLSVTLYLAKHDPALLARRMRGGPFAEKQISQKIIMSFASLGFIALLVVPGFDHRHGWSLMSPAMVVVGEALFVLGWIAIFFVFRENSFGWARIELADEQKVISSGPYALVRHPMYSAGSLLLTGIPWSLGSWWGELAMAVIVPAVILRLLDEEKFLARHLDGYVDYQNRVRYRLLPLIW
jgi:protein-S-isoprenylcysteine O-methyltransferase Ste14